MVTLIAKISKEGIDHGLDGVVPLADFTTIRDSAAFAFNPCSWVKNVADVDRGGISRIFRINFHRKPTAEEYIDSMVNYKQSLRSIGIHVNVDSVLANLENEFGEIEDEDDFDSSVTYSEAERERVGESVSKLTNSELKKLRKVRVVALFSEDPQYLMDRLKDVGAKTATKWARYVVESVEPNLSIAYSILDIVKHK